MKTSPSERLPPQVFIEANETASPADGGARWRCPAETGPPDGLEEYGGDFRHFEKPAAEVISAILARRCRPQPDDPSLSPEAAPAAPRPAAGSARPAPRAGPDTARLHSDGRLLIVGREADMVAACEGRLARHLPCLTVIETAAGRPVNKSLDVGDAPHVSDVRIRGSLGRFEATARRGKTRMPLSRLLAGAPDCFDLVLDLRPAAANGWELPPPGYYAPGSDADDLQGVLEELPRMVGDFEKPIFLYYDDTDCVHARSGLKACGRCRDICPTSALEVAEARLHIDQAACVGCGVCAAVCPTGALRCLHESPQKLLTAVRSRLTEAQRNHCRTPTVIFCEAREIADGHPPRADDPLAVWLPVAEIGCVGPEVWLSALAFGARRVIVRLPAAYPPRLRGALEKQLRWAAAIPENLGLGPDRIELIAADAAESPVPEFGKERVPNAGFSPFQSKRVLVRCAVTQLAARAANPPAWVTLPVGAPFGAIHVDPDACTLCLACAGACPTGALVAPGDVPELRLVESECLQCGRCQKICPETAVTLDPRLATDPARSELPRRLHAERPFACVRCGRGFAPPSLVAKMTARLEGHWMYGREEQIRRLKMCRDCRVRDLFEARNKDDPS